MPPLVLGLGTARAAFPPLIDLAVGGADVTIGGAAGGDHSGFSLAAGDVNGDGWNDLIVLAYWAEPLDGTRLGEIDILWGSTFPTQGDIPLGQDSPTFARVFGAMTQAYRSVVSGGDFNGDGCFDIIWGQPHGPALDFTGPDGMAYVILGSPSFPDTLDIGTAAPQVITLLGVPFLMAGFGAAACGCDLDGDGRDEIVVSAPWNDWAEVFVIWGGSSFSPLYDMSATPPGVTRIRDSVPQTGMGWGLGCADFDEDGFEDLVIGSPGIGPSYSYGTVTVLYGRSAFPDTLSMPDPSFRMKRVYKSPWIGPRVATGDIDGDGQVDLATSDASADPLGCRDCGEVYVFLGANELPDSAWLDDLTPIRIIGAGKYTHYGLNLHMADLTDDGRDELVVVGQGSIYSSTSIDQTVIVYGSTSPPETTFIGTDTTITRIRGPSHGVDLGRGLTAADFNGDGVSDLVLGAHQFQNNSGRTYVFFGIAAPTDTNVGRPNFALRQNYPNPFNPTTTITFSLQAAGDASLAVYDVAGRRVRVLLNEWRNAGIHRIEWNGRNDRSQPVASGVYFYQLVAGSFTDTKKMTILR